MAGEPLPPGPSPGETVRLLNGLLRGDAALTDELAVRVHAELHKLARHHLAGQGGDPIFQPTELVHEAWIRLFGQQSVQFEGRRQFYAFASQVMRAVLVDHARALQARKRGGGRERLSLSVAPLAMRGQEPDPAETVDLLDLDDALERLRVLDPQLARLVELRFFGGLAAATIAEILDVSERTVERHWRLARAWLLEELGR